MNEKISLIHPEYVNTIRADSYSLWQALAELVDNSLDAHAQNTNIFIVPGKDKNNNKIERIVVIDDGHGMSLEQLKGALQMGNSTKTDEEQIGKFGQGLKAASIKFADNTEIISKRNGVFSHAIIDVNDLKRNNLMLDVPVIKDDASFINSSLKYMLKNSNIDQNSIKNFTAITWTQMTNVDNGSKSTSISKHINEIEENFGRIFRKYLESGALITIWDYSKAEKFPIDPIDTLKLDKDFEIFYPQSFQDGYVPDEDGFFTYYDKINDKQVEFKIRFSQVKESRYRSYLNKNEKNQAEGYSKYLTNLNGVSFVRGQREIALMKLPKSIYIPKNIDSAKFSGCEVVYSSSQDHVFKTNAKKNALQLTKTSDLFEFFKEYVAPALREVEKRNARIIKEFKGHLIDTIDHNDPTIEYISLMHNEVLHEIRNEKILINTDSNIYQKNKFVIDALVDQINSNSTMNLKEFLIKMGDA